MERVGVVFHIDEVVVQVASAIDRWLDAGDLSLVQIIQVGDKLVSLCPNCKAIGFKRCFVETSDGVKTAEEGLWF